MFGPILRDAYTAGESPTADEMVQYAGLKGTRAEKRARGLDDAAVYEEIGKWAPWVADSLAARDDYSRKMRDMIAIEGLPKGLGIAKESFTMMLAGRDAACILRSSALKKYRTIADRLRRTPYYDTDWFMPFAKAQWMLWETIGRTPGTADHSALWEVIEPLIAEIDAG